MKRIVPLLLCAIMIFTMLPVQAKADDVTINVYNWGQYISDGTDGYIDVNKAFTEKTGIKVNYMTFDSNETMYTKLKTGGSTYDVIIPSDYMIARLIAEDIADLVDSTYGLDPAPLRRIVERQRLDVFLLRRIRRNGGYRRAYYLHLLSRMPVDEKTVRAVERYTHSRNRYVRFCALSVQMMADMSALSSKIDAYSHRLSYFELSEVLRMLRQNVQPVDYEPLILSPNRNLRMLGLSVVWRFGIEDAEEILLRIVAENRPEESVGAMYVLCTLHSVITRPEVEKFVGGMNPVQRRVLLRYIARQGYSANALQVFIPEEEKRYYVSLVDSYKLNVG